MIDIDKLSEAQVRYILNELYNGGGDMNMEVVVDCIMTNVDYPQDNNEGGE